MKRSLRWLWFLFLPAILSAQIPAGLGGAYDMNEWCTSHPFTGTRVVAQPDRALRVLQGAARCRVGVVLVYSSKSYTTNGATHGPYSGSKHRALSDRWASYLKPDTLKKYVANHTLLGIEVGDDYLAKIWNGVAIPLDSARNAANYAKTKMPNAPIGIRLDAIRAGAVTGWKIDYFHSAWSGSVGNLRRWGTADKWFAAVLSRARELGGKVMAGFNTEDCSGSNTVRCTPTLVTRYGIAAANVPGNCGLIAWYYVPSAYTGSYRTAWQGIIALAKSKPFTSCKAR